MVVETQGQRAKTAEGATFRSFTFAFLCTRTVVSMSEEFILESISGSED